MGNQSSSESLFRLIQCNEEEEVLKLLQTHCSVNSISKTGISVLRAALEQGMFSVFKYCYQHKAIMLPCIDYEQTALHRAVILGDYQFTNRVLRDPVLSRGQINIQDELGMTPLHLAVESGNSDLVSLLLKYNANRNIRNNDFKTPYDLAIINQGEMADEIIEQLTVEDYFSKISIEDISPYKELGSTQGSKSIHKVQPDEKEAKSLLEQAIEEYKVPIIKSEEIKLLEMINRGSSCLVFKGK